MSSSFSAVSGSVVGRCLLAVVAVAVGVLAGSLQVGDHVATTGGDGPDEVTGIVTQHGSVEVHNFEVADLHTYTITSSGHYSHNCPTDYGGVAKAVPDEGVYVVRSGEGEVCVGQSGNIAKRLGQHVSKDKFTQAEADAAERIEVLGGKLAREIQEQLKIDSPEFGGLDNMLNKVNPIGTRRLDLMPEGYKR